MKIPDTETLDTAIAWLRVNDGKEGEMERCEAVAAWIEHEERERYLRYAARQAGVPIARLRRQLAEQAKSAP